jgi:hypothetical protein
MKVECDAISIGALYPIVVKNGLHPPVVGDPLLDVTHLFPAKESYFASLEIGKTVGEDIDAPGGAAAETLDEVPGTKNKDYDGNNTRGDLVRERVTYYELYCCREEEQNPEKKPEPYERHQEGLQATEAPAVFGKWNP